MAGIGSPQTSIPTRWRHVNVSAHCSWLPDEERGWRSHNHMRHCSGDYKSPPPRVDHAGLRRYCRAISGEPIVMLWADRAVRRTMPGLIWAEGGTYEPVRGRIPAARYPQCIPMTNPNPTNATSNSAKR